jgi:hypothetical protein
MIANIPVQQEWQRQKTYLALIIAPICSPASVFIFELFSMVLYHFIYLLNGIRHKHECSNFSPILGQIKFFIYAINTAF